MYSKYSFLIDVICFNPFYISRLTPLGIPHTRGKIAFNVGEDLLRSASQNSRLSKERTQAGWLLIGSVMTLGPAVVKGKKATLKSSRFFFTHAIDFILAGLLPRMMLLWRNAFPRSQKELESEKSRGDAFTWRVSLEARCGAMSAIHAFLLLNGNNGHISSELVNDDTIRRLSVPVEACLNLCSNLGSVLRSYPTELKALAAMLRLRLFETISLLPPGTLEANYTQLLRLLVRKIDPTFFITFIYVLFFKILVFSEFVLGLFLNIFNGWIVCLVVIALDHNFTCIVFFQFLRRMHRVWLEFQVQRF